MEAKFVKWMGIVNNEFELKVLIDNRIQVQAQWNDIDRQIKAPRTCRGRIPF